MIRSPYLGSIFDCLHHDGTKFNALAALYNISLDYVPAQQAFREEGIFPELIKMLDSFIDDPLILHHIADLLSFAVENWDVSRSPDTVLNSLLRFAHHEDSDSDETKLILDIITMHLKEERFKLLLFEQDLFEILLVLLLRLFGYRNKSISLPEAYPWLPPPEDEKEELETIQTSALATLRDLSSFPAFFEKYPLESEITNTWFSWLHSDNPDLQIISCCLLSNLAREREIWAVQMITTYSVHLRLGELSAEEVESRVSLAAFEFLLQLARPPPNRVRICTRDFLDRLSRTWSMDQDTCDGLVRRQYASVAVLLGLISDCVEAILLFVEHAAWETIETAPRYSHSHLELLLAFFNRISDTRTRIEIAKVVMAVTKALAALETTPVSSIKSIDANKIWRDCLSISPAFVTPVFMILSQSEDPALQAQGYFTLVIVARHQMAVKMVADVMQTRPVFEQLVQAITKESVISMQTIPNSEDTDLAQRASMQRSVSENARYLVKEVLDRKVSLLGVFEFLGRRFRSLDA